ncbi:hypothetical protein ACFQ4C_17950 [Larkinella insperata]|uniref:Uncharacterized protein n=1 Tax=Larkinella insperata TaxID=332158 RepID=A0ABW3QNB1_9BACT|nr:hypothetical protein [Larkinella insperata]
MTPTNKDTLASRKAAFANSSGLVYEWAKTEDNAETVKLVAQAIDDAIDLISALEVKADTPRHQHQHGPTNNHYDRKEIQSNVYVANQTSYNVNGHALENSVHVEVGRDLFYKLSKDLIISSSGHMVIRPESKKLLTAVGEIDLSDTELSRLQSFLKTDFGV